MISPAPGAKVMVATRPVAFRRVADSLAALVAAEYDGTPYSGVIYLQILVAPGPVWPKRTAKSEYKRFPITSVHSRMSCSGWRIRRAGRYQRACRPDTTGP